MVRETGIVIISRRKRRMNFATSIIIIASLVRLKNSEQKNRKKMKAKQNFLLWSAILIFSCCVQAQSITDSTATKKEKKYQATAPSAEPFGKEAFAASNNTTIR